MTNNNFDPSQRRGQPKNKAQWVAHENSLPEKEAALPLPGDRITLDVDEGVNLQGFEGPFHSLDIRRNNDVDGSPTFTIVAESQVNYAWFAPAELTDGKRDEWANENHKAISSCLTERYNLEVSNATWDSDETSWQEVTFAVEHKGELTDVLASELAWNDTEAVRLYNESDSGTFGSENLDRVVRDYVDAHAVISNIADTEDIWRGRIDTEAPLSDASAVTIARYASTFRPGLNHRYPELQRFVRTGIANRSAARAELAEAGVPGWMNLGRKREIEALSAWFDNSSTPSA